LGGVLFSSIAILYTSLVPSFYSFNYYFTLFITPMFFFSGVFFPLSNFPEIVQNISLIIPLTPVVQISRALVSGEFSPNLLISLAIIIVLSAIFFLISMITMRRRLTV
jgi:lipooligosaccharide transport system permease protein